MMNDAHNPGRPAGPLRLARAALRRLPYLPRWAGTLARRALGRAPRRKTLWIHIGAHKTGTTSLQRLLWQERHALMAQDVWFDEPANEFGRLLTRHSPLSAEEIERHRREQRARWEARPESVILLSSEFLFGDPDRGYRNIREVAGDLKKITEGFDARIVACIRRQDSFIESWYHQHLKRGGMHTFEAFLERMGAGSFRWDELLEVYAGVFDAAPPRVVVFEELRSDPVPMIERFFGGLGRPLRVRHAKLREFNPSFSRKAVELALHTYPKLTVEERLRFRDALFAAFPRPAGEEFGLFTDEARAALLRDYEESNRRCFARFCGGPELAVKHGYARVK